MKNERSVVEKKEVNEEIAVVISLFIALYQRFTLVLALMVGPCADDLGELSYGYLKPPSEGNRTDLGSTCRANRS